MNKQRMWIFVIIIVAVFFLFNPFKSGRDQDVRRPWVSDDTLKPLVEYINANYTKPNDYIIDLFDDRQIVMLGEMGRIREQVRFVTELIPELYKNGINNLGIEYALHKDQDKLDRLLTANSFNETLAKEIYFNWMVLWGYEEYIELLRSAWNVNRSAGEDEAKFRVVGLNVEQHYDAIQTQEDLEDNTKLAAVLRDGIPDIFMAQVIEEEFIDRNKKALIFGNFQRTVTKYENYMYKENMEKSGFSDFRRMGNIVYNKIGGRSFAVFMHSPWSWQESQTRMTYPVEGTVDAVIEAVGEDKREFGFDVKDSPFASIPLRSGDFSYGYDDSLIFEQLCDGYVVIGPFSAYTAVTGIENFINDGNLQEALVNFPGPKEEDIGAKELNDYIAQIAKKVEESIQKFK